MSETYLTRAGYEKLVGDLNALKKRKTELSREIGEAAEKGDLRENADYTSAKEKQAEVLRRIHELEDKLKGARLVDDLKIKAGEVQIGVRVTLREKESGDEFTWTLVGADEADPAAGKISVYAPLAQGILGRKLGEEVRVQLPAGPKSFKIVKTESAL